MYALQFSLRVAAIIGALATSNNMCLLACKLDCILDFVAATVQRCENCLLASYLPILID